MFLSGRTEGRWRTHLSDWCKRGLWNRTTRHHKPDRQRAPVTFKEPKYRVTELYFRGFYWNSTTLRILSSFIPLEKDKSVLSQNCLQIM